MTKIAVFWYICVAILRTYSKITVGLIKLQSFNQYKEKFNTGTQNSLLGYFPAGICKKVIVIFAVSNFTKCKILCKKTASHLEQKWHLNSFGPQFYLKFAPSNLPKCKVRCKTKNIKFATKNVLFGYFWVANLKSRTWNTVLAIHTMEFLKMQSFIQYQNP